ncbi:MAG: hypothetical protein EHM81_00340 [Chloroflexi bacterium]|nr:MAG: hypothetical protein EHM81_00340 [Chloroflexota bacterium]
MYKKIFASFISVVALIAIIIGLGGFQISDAQASAPEAAQNTSGIRTSIQDKVRVAASRPWTVEEMKAAKPYPMMEMEATAETVLGADLSLELAGPAVFAPGARPGGKAVKAAAEEEELAGMETLAYPLSYPAPFTRQNISSFSNVTNYPFSAIGKLFFNQGGYSYVCSASVQGASGIVTAGHCVHAGNNKSSGWSYNVVFVPAYNNGSAPFGQWTVDALSTRTPWYKSEEIRADWGAGRVVRNAYGYGVGNYTGWLGYAYGGSRVKSWWEVGYPAASPFTGQVMVACQASYAYDSPFGAASYPAAMGTGCDMTGGCSGGPWIWKFGTSNYLNGVNSHRRVGYKNEMFSPFADKAAGSLFKWARSW